VYANFGQLAAEGGKSPASCGLNPSNTQPNVDRYRVTPQRRSHYLVPVKKVGTKPPEPSADFRLRLVGPFETRQDCPGAKCLRAADAGAYHLSRVRWLQASRTTTPATARACPQPVADASTHRPQHVLTAALFETDTGHEPIPRGPDFEAQVAVLVRTLIDAARRTPNAH
jgi:hypothetical protein